MDHGATWTWSLRGSEASSSLPRGETLVTTGKLSSLLFCYYSVQFSSVQSLSCVYLFAAPWTAARQASLSNTNSRSLLKLMSIKSVMPSNHLILCHPLLLPPSIFPGIRVFSSESVLHIKWPKHWSFSFNEYSHFLNIQD